MEQTNNYKSLQSIPEQKQYFLSRIVQINPIWETWCKRNEKSASVEELEQKYNELLLSAKKEFLKKVLEYLEIKDESLNKEVSECNDSLRINEIAKLYSVAYYKKKLLTHLKEAGLIRTERDIKRINDCKTIEDVKLKTEASRKLLTTYLRKQDEFQRSLYGSEYVSTGNSIQAILTGMIN